MRITSMHHSYRGSYWVRRRRRYRYPSRCRDNGRCRWSTRIWRSKIGSRSRSGSVPGGILWWLGILCSRIGVLACYFLVLVAGLVPICILFGGVLHQGIHHFNFVAIFWCAASGRQDYRYAQDGISEVFGPDPILDIERNMKLEEQADFDDLRWW